MLDYSPCRTCKPLQPRAEAEDGDEAPSNAAGFEDDDPNG
jgi:hypothetical protein